MTAPVEAVLRGSRRDLALGRRLKPGHDFSVGIPQSSNILCVGGVGDFSLERKAERDLCVWS